MKMKKLSRNTWLKIGISAAVVIVFVTLIATGMPTGAKAQTYTSNYYWNNPPYYPSYYYPPYYYYPQYSPLTVTCYAGYPSIYAGSSVTWYAHANGGTGSYSYQWNLGGYIPNFYNYSNVGSVTAYYPYPGTQSASVTVRSGYQTITRYCGYVNVMARYYNPYPYSYPYQYQPYYYQSSQ